MTQLSEELLAYSRACEHLLSTEITLNEDESSLVEYYVQELSSKIRLPWTDDAQSGGTTDTSSSCAR